MKTHILHFVVLALLLAAGAGAFFLVSGSDSMQLFVGIITAIAYVTWGLLHHALQNDLHPKVVIEYVLVGVISVVLLIVMLGS